jgi:hypothetical protein
MNVELAIAALGCFVLSPARFRGLFSALRSTVWLDTPAAPPGAEPVGRAGHPARLGP